MVRPASGGCRDRFGFLRARVFAMSGDDGRGSGRGADRHPDGDLSERLKRLETQLDRKRDPAPGGGPRSEASTSDPSAIGRAFRMSSEFVAGVIAGGGLGWLLDRLLGTSPWGLIVFLLLGFAAGTFNVVRAAGATTTSGGTGSKPPNS
jgi:ATP synthase protein I